SSQGGKTAKMPEKLKTTDHGKGLKKVEENKGKTLKQAELPTLNDSKGVILAPRKESVGKEQKDKTEKFKTEKTPVATLSQAKRIDSQGKHDTSAKQLTSANEPKNAIDAVNSNHIEFNVQRTSKTIIVTTKINKTIPS